MSFSQPKDLEEETQANTQVNYEPNSLIYTT